MGGQIDLIVSNFPESLPHVKSGKLRALAVTSKERHPLLPDVPTTAEVGFPQLTITNWTGVMVPARPRRRSSPRSTPTPTRRWPNPR